MTTPDLMRLGTDGRPRKTLHATCPGCGAIVRVLQSRPAHNGRLARPARRQAHYTPHTYNGLDRVRCRYPVTAFPQEDEQCE